MEDVEASSPNLRGRPCGVGRGQCQNLPIVYSSSEVVIASRPDFPMLHTATQEDFSSQRRAYSRGCGSWGSIRVVEWNV